MSERKQVLVMYDVRGIQNYIFRTAALKDAIGASAIVENIILDALRYAIKKIREEESFGILTVELDWYNEEGVLPFVDDKKDIQVLYIGGGNAYVLMSSRDLAIAVNRRMSFYVMEHTYSLQLAVAMQERHENYSQDYQDLNEEMIRVKTNMKISKPLGALPVMRVETKTGYPLSQTVDGKTVSTETRLKKGVGSEARNYLSELDKKIDSFVIEKGRDSQIGVVHIDGNSMGIRIRNLVKNITDYKKAVDIMRAISHQIDSCYKKVFDEMRLEFNKKGAALLKKSDENIIMKVLTAGDDITYVCNAKFALASVEYFCKKITQYSLTDLLYAKGYPDGETRESNLKKNGFSVCAGIAYIGSHFPFSVGYDVAESCCDNAKKRAKEEQNISEGCIGNWVDFHICKNIQSRDLEGLRKREYVTSYGEGLLLRPYFIPVADENEGAFKKIAESAFSFRHFDTAVNYFQDTNKIPRIFIKRMRNTYPLGEKQMNMLWNFMKSRGRELPDTEVCKNELYIKIGIEKIALWYDALEMSDDYISLTKVVGED